MFNPPLASGSDGWYAVRACLTAALHGLTARLSRGALPGFYSLGMKKSLFSSHTVHRLEISRRRASPQTHISLDFLEF